MKEEKKRTGTEKAGKQRKTLDQESEGEAVVEKEWMDGFCPKRL